MSRANSIQSELAKTTNMVARLTEIVGDLERVTAYFRVQDVEPSTKPSTDVAPAPPPPRSPLGDRLFALNADLGHQCRRLGAILSELDTVDEPLGNDEPIEAGQAPRGPQPQPRRRFT